MDEARYLEVIRRKTAKLFEASARLGAVLAGQPQLEHGLAEYGRRVGTAFQLVDDVLDYGGDLGKSLGDDLAEGKATLPLIYAMGHGTKDQAELIQHAIREGRLADLSAVLTAIRETGAIEYARRQAGTEARTACAALDLLAASQYRDYLLQLADFAVTRTY